MLRERSVAFRDLSPSDAEEVFKYVSSNSVLKHPIRNCAKFFAKMTEDRVLTYAREKFDLGTDVITAAQITSRLNNVVLSAECFAGLSVFEKVAEDCWPLLPGSNSWIQLEVMTYDPKTVIMGRIVRLSSLGHNNITTTRRLDKITTEFNSGPSTQVGDWTVTHANLSEVKTSAVEDASEILDMLLVENSDCESGFYMYTDFGKIRVVGDSFSSNKKDSLSVPFGVLK